VLRSTRDDERSPRLPLDGFGPPGLAMTAQDEYPGRLSPS